MPQPVALTDHGVLLTVGFVTLTDRWQIVLPIAYDFALGNIDAEHQCQDAIVSFSGVPFTDLLACLSMDTYCNFIAAEGMVDGLIPHRVDFAVGAQSGTRGAGTAPSNVCGLITWYEDPIDIPPGSRMRTGKTFLSGLAVADLAGDGVVNILQTAMQTFGGLMLSGYASSLVPATNWYRYLACPLPRARGFPIKRVGVMAARNYVATQRRRMIPR